MTKQAHLLPQKKAQTLWSLIGQVPGQNNPLCVKLTGQGQQAHLGLLYLLAERTHMVQ